MYFFYRITTYLAIIISPLIIFKDKSPLKALIINAVSATVISLTCYGLYLITNDLIQWLAFGVGVYLLSCWIQGLKNRDPITFGLIFKTKLLME